MVLSGGIRSPAALGHLAVIVVAVWLLGRREAIWIAVLTLAFGLGLAKLEYGGILLPAYFPIPPIEAWGFAVGLVCLTILPLSSVNRALTESAERARKDLEARLREETARAEADSRFRATFFQAAVGIAQTGLDGQWLLQNDRLCEILGYSLDELSHKTLLEITHPDDAHDLRRALRQLLAGEISSWSQEKRFIRKEGGIVWGRVFTSLVRDSHNQPQYYITVLEDISGKIETERALRDAEQHLKLALNGAHLVVWSVDLPGGTVTVCGEPASFYGLSPGRTTRTVREWISLIHPDDREQLVALRHGSPDQTRPWEVEFRVLWPEHGMRWIRAKGSLVPNDSGPPTSAIGICMDITERKLTEDALRSSQQLLELAQSAAEIGSYERDLATGVVRCSRGFPALYGLPPSESGPSYEEWLESIHPEDRGMMTQHRIMTTEGGDAWEKEFRVVWPDGSVHWLLSKGLLQRDSQGLPTRSVGVNMDITERKLAEEALRNSQQRLELAQAAAGIATYDWDTRTRIGHCSKEFPTMYGLPPAEIGPPYEQWLEMIHPDDRARVFSEGAKTLERGDDWDTEFRVTWPDGSVHWLYARGNLLRDEHGHPSRIIGINMDVTERKQAEEALRGSQQRLELAQAASGVASYDWDIGTEVGHCTELLPALYGLPPGNVAPSTEQWREGIHPDDRDAVVEQWTRILDGDGTCTTEFRVIWPDNSVHWLLSKGLLLRDSQRNPSRLVGVTMDITARKRAEDESVARQKLEGLGMLAGGIAHDFNNLLGSILAESELLLDEVGDSAAVSTAVTNISAVVNGASEIVRELMAYAGQTETVLAPLDLSALVREILQLLRVSISKQAVMDANLPEGLRCVRANSAQIAQVVMNLITNASEALGERPGVISVSTAQSEDHLTLVVSDTGCGMTDDVKARIFDPFFSTKFAGRGLGLAAVQGIIRKHGGTISVESVPGKGSFFTILLPAINEPASDSSPLSSAASASPDGGSVRNCTGY